MSVLNDRIKERRLACGKTLLEIAEAINVREATMQRYESGRIKNIKHETIVALAEYFNCSPAYLMGWEDANGKTDIALGQFAPGKSENEIIDVTKKWQQRLIPFPVIGVISAGYDGQALEEYTGEIQYIPISVLRGRDPKDFFVLRVSGDSMYPQLLDGDNVLILRCTSVDSGKVAAVLYENENATIKRVSYIKGENWFDLIPANPEYMAKRIEGRDIEQCRILGKVTQLIRTLE